jgi:hypothetical protein
VLPINIVQSKLPDLADAETINGEEHENGAAAHITWSIRVDTLE